MEKGIHLCSGIGPLLDVQQFDEGQLDIACLENAKKQAGSLAQLGSSCVSLFDMNKKTHIFYSDNFGAIFGYDIKHTEAYGIDFIKDKIHPGHQNLLNKNALASLGLLLAF